MSKPAFALFAALAVLAGGVAEAGGGWHGHGHHHGGGYYRGGWGWGGYGGGWGWGGGAAFAPRIVIGGPGPYGWGNAYPYYGAGYPYYGYGFPYPAPVYQQPIVVAPPEPQVYVQQEQPASQYWYYCQDPKGYYPYVEKCRDEWMQVVPRSDSSPEPR